jgi:hypothetical protein
METDAIVFNNELEKIENNDDMQWESLFILKKEIIEINGKVKYNIEIIHEVQSMLKSNECVEVIPSISRNTGKPTKLDLTSINKPKLIRTINTARDMRPLSKIEEHIFNTLEGNNTIAVNNANNHLNKPLKRSINILM